MWPMWPSSGQYFHCSHSYDKYKFKPSPFGTTTTLGKCSVNFYKYMIINIYIILSRAASTSELEQRVRVSYDVIDVYDRKCVWGGGVLSVSSDRRPPIVDGLRQVHEAHVPPDDPVRVVGRASRGR